AAEAGVVQAIACARRERWLAENQEAFESSSAFVKKHGLRIMILYDRVALYALYLSNQYVSLFGFRYSGALFHYAVDDWLTLFLSSLGSLNRIKCSISRIIKVFWSGKLSATSNANATRVLSLTSCSTGRASKCWLRRRYQRNKKEPQRLLPSASAWFLTRKYNRCAARLAT